MKEQSTAKEPKSITSSHFGSRNNQSPHLRGKQENFFSQHQGLGIPHILLTTSKFTNKLNTLYQMSQDQWHTCQDLLQTMKVKAKRICNLLITTQYPKLTDPKRCSKCTPQALIVE